MVRLFKQCIFTPFQIFGHLDLKIVKKHMDLCLQSVQANQ